MVDDERGILRGEWRQHFCIVPRKVEGRWVWLRSVWYRSWYVGCAAGAWSGRDYQLAAPNAGVKGGYDETPSTYFPQDQQRLK